LQEGESETAEQSQVLGGILLLHPIVILSEVHVELPMQVVLDPPVLTQPTGIVFRTGPLVTDEKATLGSGFPRHGPLAVTQPEGGQTGPSVGMADPLGAMQDRIAAILLTPMTALARLVFVVIHASEVGVERLNEGVLDVFEEVFLVVL